MNLDFNQLHQNFYTHQHPKEFRLGQAAFNYVYQYLPEVANQIRGTNKDPFYNDKALAEFWDEVKRLYDTTNS